MDIFDWIFVIVISFWLIKKSIDLFQTIFPDVPKWQSLHGKEYLKWKKENN